MTERKRLIELINDAKDIYPTIPIINGMKQDSSEVIADHLLSNGVIVPPCKVGDTIYMPWEYDGVRGVAGLYVTHIIYGKKRIYVDTSLYKLTDDDTYFAKYKFGEFEFTDFGKTVFLTKEEAKKALKERSEGK